MLRLIVTRALSTPAWCGFAVLLREWDERRHEYVLTGGEGIYVDREHGGNTSRSTTVRSPGPWDEELADLLIHVCAIANRMTISLDDAPRTKESFNETRVWTSGDLSNVATPNNAS